MIILSSLYLLYEDIKENGACSWVETNEDFVQSWSWKSCFWDIEMTKNKKKSSEKAKSQQHKN